MKEKLPNSECYVYIEENKIRLEIRTDEPVIINKAVFNFHELIMFWYWNDDQIKKYFFTRKIIEGMTDWSYTAYK